MLKEVILRWEDYFDLNKRAARTFSLLLAGFEQQEARGTTEKVEIPEEEEKKKAKGRSPLLFDYSRLFKQRQLNVYYRRPRKPTDPMPPLNQILIYVSLILGVLFSSAVEQFKIGRGAFPNITSGSVILAIVIALILFPSVYEKLSIMPGTPLFVQLGLSIQHGVFWYVVSSAIS